jgi:hypothetical protein
MSSPLGFDPRSVQPVVSRYTGYAIPAPTRELIGLNVLLLVIRNSIVKGGGNFLIYYTSICLKSLRKTSESFIRIADILIKTGLGYLVEKVQEFIETDILIRVLQLTHFMKYLDGRDEK